MRIFVTGASGFIGSRVTADLIGAGHQVLGLARSDASAAAIVASGAEAHRGALDDLASLRAGAAKSDGVIHLAFIHDFSQFEENCATDRRAIEAIGEELAGSDRPLVVTGGASLLSPGKTSTELDPGVPSSIFPRGATEEAADAVASRGVRSYVVRLPQVHDPERQGLVSLLIQVAQEKGFSAYVGDGANRWPAVHVRPTAHLYRLAIEADAPSGRRYHAIGEEGVPARAIAEAVARRINLPAKSISADEALAHFGWLAHFVTADTPASSALTQKWLGWDPSGPGLIEDILTVEKAVTY